MVAASKLRRAQERIQQARPFATQMLRVLNSLASRVDPSLAPAARRARDAARRRALAADRRSPPTAGCAAASTRTSIKAAGKFIVETARARSCSGWSAGAGATTSRGAAFEVRLRADQPVRAAQVRGREGDRRRRRSDAFTSGEVDSVYLVYNEFKSVMAQRVVAERLLPIPRVEPIDAGDSKTGRPTIEYLYEPAPGNAVQAS